MKKLTRVVFVPLLLCAAAVYANEDYTLNAELSATSDDNLNRNPAAGTEVADTFATASISIQQAHPISEFDFINYSARLKYDHFDEVDGLNNAEAGATFKYNYKPDAGFAQPVYIFSADIALLDSATDIRDSTLFNGGITVSSWITTTLSMRGGAAYRIKDSDSRVFDNKEMRYFVNADLQVSNPLTAYTTFSYIDGQTVATVSQANFSPGILAVIDLADDFEPDPTFAADEIAYVFDSKTRLLTFGANYALAQQHSLDFSVRKVHSRGGSVVYKTTQFGLSYLLSF